MLRIFVDKDNIAFIGNQVKSTQHSHCVLQAFLSLDAPLQVIIANDSVNGKCIVVNKNVKHAFSCNHAPCLSILIEPSSCFANELSAKMNGDYIIYEKENLDTLQRNAAPLISATDKEQYLTFVQDFAEYFGIKRSVKDIDERINKLLEILKNCDCYDHTIESFAREVCLSSSRLSHLFREQIGVPLKSYILFHQLERAFTAVLSGQSITDAAMSVGFDSPSHFAATVKKWMGVSVNATLKNSEFLKVFIEQM